MNALTEQEELLIQNKIDNNLSELEQKQFDELLEKSEYAREFYQNLLSLHSDFITDEKSMPEIDISENIITSIYENQDSFNENKTKLFQLNASKIFSYAALIVFGIVIGSVATLYKTNTEIEKSNIAGTMSSNHRDIIYEDNSTQIRFQKISTDVTELNTFAIKTTDNLIIRISTNTGELSTENISELSNNTSLTLLNQSDNELQYSFTGDKLIQTMTKNMDLNIEITRKNEVLCHVKSD